MQAKTPYSYVHKKNIDNQILGNKNLGTQTRRKLIDASHKEDTTFLSLTKPQNVSKASKDEH